MMLDQMKDPLLNYIGVALNGIFNLLISNLGYESAFLKQLVLYFIERTLFESAG